MRYINLTTGARVSLQAIAAEHPNTSFPQLPTDADMAVFGYACIHATPVPTYDGNTHRVREAEPLFKNGRWQQVWEVYELPPPPPPAEVMMRQARLALLAAGKLSLVAAAIDALPSGQREAASIEWEYSPTVKRHNGFVESIGHALGMGDAELDALFTAAEKL